MMYGLSPFKLKDICTFAGIPQPLTDLTNSFTGMLHVGTNSIGVCPNGGNCCKMNLVAGFVGDGNLSASYL